jgi:2-(1,2-epoxy-1,2-dihydrophenyl)acetyl-CoA isomerase
MSADEWPGNVDGVRVDVADGVATIEMCRPPNNYLDVSLIAGIAEALEHCDADRSVRAAVLCSEGKHFSGGAALGGSSEDTSPQSAPTRHLYDEAIRLFRCQVPIVAATQGAAVGGGLGLALAADFRVCGPSSRFTANFTRLGFHHGFGLSVTLPRLVGHQQALRLILGSERIDGTEAKQIGLVDELVPDDEIRAAAHNMAQRMAENAPLAVRSVRATLRGTLAEEVEKAMAHERSEQQRLAATNDFREGVAATAERRTPVFTGE